jgi:nicotinamidase-related amidase
MRLDRTKAILAIIDVQERLMPVIHERFETERNIERLVRGAHVLGVPVVVTEQYVKGLAPTVEPLRNALEETCGYRPIEKNCFSAHGCEAFATKLGVLERKQVILAGVEAHVCVFQTALDLLAADFGVWIAVDAVSSRTAQNKAIAMQRLVSEGARLTSTEMALFEMLVVSGTNEFREISKIIK